MGNFTKQIEDKKEVKEKDKVRREKIAGYFFNLSQLTFAALALGGMSPFYTPHGEVGVNWYVLATGALLTVLLAIIGNKTLKS